MKTNEISKSRLWTGRIMSGLVIFFMLFDAVFKFFVTEEALAGTTQLGWGAHHLVPLGIIALVATILYAVPATSVMGAILLTGYFGGAIATHFRIDNPLFSHTLFPVYLAILMWGGVWLRNPALRAIFPMRGPGVVTQ